VGDQSPQDKGSYFLTYDTTGLDWTIRLWDLNKGDQLISSLTCASRIISLDVNTSPFYMEHTSGLRREEEDDDQDQDQDPTYVVASLYGIQELFIFKFDTLLESHHHEGGKRNHDNNAYSDNCFSDDPSLHGQKKEINL
jgi:hypothetical protein